mmetsp:Transcript_10273/g.15724  ORF Transcript_10273/g.15724 Transcript_10273/m.15724 type:complete len:84 (-) Transcript_10273:134-385(-)
MREMWLCRRCKRYLYSLLCMGPREMRSPLLSVLQSVRSLTVSEGVVNASSNGGTVVFTLYRLTKLSVMCWDVAVVYYYCTEIS